MNAISRTYEETKRKWDNTCKLNREYKAKMGEVYKEYVMRRFGNPNDYLPEDLVWIDTSTRLEWVKELLNTERQNVASRCDDVVGGTTGGSIEHIAII